MPGGSCSFGNGACLRNRDKVQPTQFVWMEGDSGQAHDGHLRQADHHDFLEFPNGQKVLLTDLLVGQEATVLQLPAQPITAVQTKGQKRIRPVR